MFVGTAALILLCLTVIVYSPQPQAMSPPLQLDGLGTPPVFSSAGAVSQLLTTTKGNDVIILIVESLSSDTAISGIIDSNGLTFAKRVSYTVDSFTLSEYYSRATSPLESDNITVACNCPPGYFLISETRALAIHGANTRAIFDRNPSIPATCALSGCGDCSADRDLNPGTCSVSIQTSTIDFVMALTAINDAPGCGGYPDSPAGYRPPPGFTTLTSDSTFELDYMITTIPQSRVMFACNGTDAEAIMVDAISFNGAFGF